MAIRLGCVCVAGADGAVRACGRAYARCEERWKVRMGIARNDGNGGKQKKKPAAGCSGRGYRSGACFLGVGAALAL